MQIKKNPWEVASGEVEHVEPVQKEPFNWKQYWKDMRDGIATIWWTGIALIIATLILGIPACGIYNLTVFLYEYYPIQGAILLAVLIASLIFVPLLGRISRQRGWI